MRFYTLPNTANWTEYIVNKSACKSGRSTLNDDNNIKSALNHHNDFLHSAFLMPIRALLELCKYRLFISVFVTISNRIRPYSTMCSCRRKFTISIVLPNKFPSPVQLICKSTSPSDRRRNCIGDRSLQCPHHSSGIVYSCGRMPAVQEEKHCCVSIEND